MESVPGRIVGRIVNEVARETGRDPVALPPLYEIVDPDALSVVVETLDNGTVAFRYAECEVALRSGEGIDVRPVDQSGDERTGASEHLE